MQESSLPCWNFKKLVNLERIYGLQINVAQLSKTCHPSGVYTLNLWIHFYNLTIPTGLRQACEADMIIEKAGKQPQNPVGMTNIWIFSLATRHWILNLNSLV